MFGTGWAVGDETDGAGEHQDAEPAGERKMLVQPETAEQGDEDIAKGSRWHDEGEVGPGEGGHVRGEEAHEQDDASNDVQIEECVIQQGQVMDVDWADLRHSAREQRVTEGRGDDYGEQDGVLLEGEAMFHVDRVPGVNMGFGGCSNWIWKEKGQHGVLVLACFS